MNNNTSFSRKVLQILCLVPPRNAVISFFFKCLLNLGTVGYCNKVSRTFFQVTLPPSPSQEPLQEPRDFFGTFTPGPFSLYDQFFQLQKILAFNLEHFQALKELRKLKHVFRDFRPILYP